MEVMGRGSEITNGSLYTPKFKTEKVKLPPDDLKKPNLSSLVSSKGFWSSANAASSENE
jgi:hypothetical protein